MKSFTLRSWVAARGLEALDLDPKLSNLTQPTDMADREAVIDRLALSIRKGETIVCYGDFDVDGSTACAILTEILQALGGRVYPLLSSRFHGGYGLNDQQVDRILKLSPKLVITLDCGSSDHARLRRLEAAGVDRIVIDHHLVPDEKLPALFINPHRPECNFGYKWLASCGLALSIGAGLRTKIGVTLNMTRWLPLVAVGTIADVAPLTGDNRILVQAGLELLRKGANPGLLALAKAAKLDLSKSLTGRDIGWRVAPQINAPGRLQAPDILLDLFMAKTADEADTVTVELQRLSALRRQITSDVQEQAESEIDAVGYNGDPALVIGRPEWLHGVVGITAGRLVDKYRKPAIVVGGHDGAITGSGSARGPAGYNLHQALTECQKYLIKFGGHAAAAGCSIEWDKLSDFRKAFCEAISRQTVAAVDNSDMQLRLDPKDTLRSILCDLEKLEPCGQSNPRPQIIAEGLITTAKEVKGGHLSVGMLLPNGQLLKGFRVGEGEKANSLLTQQAVWRGDLRPTSYGKEGVEMFVEEITTPSGAV